MEVMTRKKLIEVALPLEAINIASAREKSIRHGHPSTLHLWWARRPLAAARAVIFSQMVDDPSSHPELFPTEAKQEKERQRLFRIIEQLVLWENTTNEKVLNQAREEIKKSWSYTCSDNKNHPQAKELFNPDKLPAFHDPFAGGGSLPLEAQRLGLEAYASDLNPVAVLICKAMIEIPPKFAGKPPVNPESRQNKTMLSKEWRGAEGLAEDVRYYGKWMRDEAEKRIGHLYPKIEITAEMVQERPDLKPYLGRKLTVIAWLWARTVKSPNPAFRDVDVPLTTSFMLSTKPDKEAFILPVIEGKSYRFTVKIGKPVNSIDAQKGTKIGSSGSTFFCLMSKSPVSFEYIRAEAKAGRMGSRLLAVVVAGDRGRVFLPPTTQMETIAKSAIPQEVPETELPKKALGFRIQEYGMTKWRDLFTPRQLTALTTFSCLVREAREQVNRDTSPSGMRDDDLSLDAGGSCTQAYADAVAVYLAFAVDYAANYWSTIATPADGFIRGTFARQAVPMTWDYAEAPPFGETSGNWLGGIGWITKVLALLPNATSGQATQADASNQSMSKQKIISTDPPYYDNIGYADLSDFFYMWLRQSLRTNIPSLFSTLTTPKIEEIVAAPYRHGSKVLAESFFLNGMTKAMHRLTEQAHPAFPVTIYYAFKQSETGDNDEGTSSTGWETFLEAVIRAGFSLTGTWPMRTERSSRSVSIDTNALASSIIMVCRARPQNAPTSTRREFLNSLKVELPLALTNLQQGNIAPVDLAQAAIGPGMAIYTRYSKVLDAAGNYVSVHEALTLINQTLDDVLAEQEGDFDSDTRWALAWFEQYGFNQGDYGVAETLSKAKNTSVSGMEHILISREGKVQLLKPSGLPPDWDPAKDKRLTVWEMVHHLIRVLEASGEDAAAELLAQLGSQAEVARELSYRLYTICERKKRAQEASSYNSLVQSWPEIQRLAGERNKQHPQQSAMFGEG